MISKRYGFFRLPCSTGTDEIRCLCPFPAAADYREPGTGNWLRREALYRSSRSDTIIIHYSLFILHLRAALHPRSGTAHDRARLSRGARGTDAGIPVLIFPDHTGTDRIRSVCPSTDYCADRESHLHFTFHPSLLPPSLLTFMLYLKGQQVVWVDIKIKDL